ncbi:MAG: hypothetical protein LUQ24_03710 [Methanobacterium sp.]|nr:hypothetical protein [Methanobacterium sp.]
MNKIVKLILFGFLIWLVPFLISLLIFPLKSTVNPLFESIMPVVISATVVCLAYLYLTGIEKDYLKEGLTAGVTWLIISLIIDLILFLPASPMQMSFTSYIMDIGITYLMIPIITTGMGMTTQNIKINS